MSMFASGQARNANGSTGYPIARSFAFVVLLALVALFALRHLFGSVRFEGGVR